jgi:hypothetical protein
MTTEQMELGYNETEQAAFVPARKSRAARAAWWFARMRKVVQSAVDWQPAPQPPAEQVWLPGTRRELKF